MIILKSFNHITLFHRQLHAAIYATTDVNDLKSTLMRLDWACSSMDPTSAVDWYPDPWWKIPSVDTDIMFLVDGLPDFIAQVCSSTLFYFKAFITIS
jgi:hypothetical protein